MKEELTVLLAEARLALTAPDVDKEMAAGLLENIARFEATLTRKSATRDEIALQALELGMYLGAPSEQRLINRQGSDAAAGRKGRKNRADEDRAHLEKVFAAIDERLAGEPNDSEIARKVEKIYFPNQPKLSVRTLRTHVAARRAQGQIRKPGISSAAGPRQSAACKRLLRLPSPGLLPLWSYFRG